MNLEDKCLIRRIRKGETKKLIEIQSEATEFNSFFKHHKEWFLKAIDEVSSSNRIAFGAFRTFTDSKSQCKVEELVCSVIVKKGEFSNQLELKNLIFNAKPYRAYTDFTSEEISRLENDIKKQLVNKVVSFCERRGYDSIETEIPSTFNHDISTLISCGFKALSLREKYETGKYVNVLQNKLGEVYQGDPFDLNKMIEWAAKHFFPFKKINKREAYFYNNTPLLISSLHFSISPKLFQTQFLEVDERELVSIHGEFIIDLFNDNLEDFIKNPAHFFSPQADLKYLVSDNSSKTLIEKCKKNKIKLLDMSALKKILGDCKSSLKIPFGKEDVAGAITLLEPKYKNIIQNFEGEFVYFLLSGLGSSLSHLDEETHILAFYAPPSEDFNGGFWGFADIELIHSKPYDDAFNYFPYHVGKLITEEDLLFYKTYSENEDVIILKCRNFHSFENPIRPMEIKNKELQNYLFEELNEENASSVYFDWSLNEFFKSYRKPTHNTNQMEHKKSENKKGFDWTTFLLETGKGIPQVGGLLFGGIQKMRDNRADNRRFEELNLKIDALIDQNKDVSKNALDSIMGNYFDIPLNEIVIDTVAEIINIAVKEHKNIGKFPTPKKVVPLLKLSQFPLPVDEDSLRREMDQLYGSRNKIQSFRYALESTDYILDVSDNTTPRHEVLLFCKTLKGKDLVQLQKVFIKFKENHPNSAIITEIVDYLNTVNDNTL